MVLRASEIWTRKKITGFLASSMIEQRWAGELVNKSATWFLKPHHNVVKCLIPNCEDSNHRISNLYSYKISEKFITTRWRSIWQHCPYFLILRWKTPYHSVPLRSIPYHPVPLRSTSYHHGISKIFQCCKTLNRLFRFSMFIYIFLMKTNFVSKQFQELPSEISKIFLCLQTLECLLWFPMFIYIFFDENKLSFETIPGIAERNFENFALFANTGVFVMVSNVYLHFFDENKLCFETFTRIAERNFENFALFANTCGLFV